MEKIFGTIGANVWKLSVQRDGSTTIMTALKQCNFYYVSVIYFCCISVNDVMSNVKK